MSGQLVFYSISALLGMTSRMEGIWFIFIFLLYLIWIYIVKKTAPRLIFIHILIYIGFIFVSDLSLLKNKTEILQEQAQFQIQFTDRTQINGDRLRAVVTESVTNEKLIFIYKIPSENQKNDLQQNPLLKKTCTIKGKLETPSSARNENSFDYQEYLKHQNVFWELHVSKWDIESCEEDKLALVDKLKLLRIKGIALIEKNFSKETAPVAAALIFGTRDLLLNETISAYQKIGVIHLISISGLHVALIVGFSFYIGLRLGVVREKLYWTLILLLPLYAVLTGGAPSVNRAVIMTMIILVVRRLKWLRKLKALDGLCISFILLCFLNPFIIYNIGFQLSYIVTFSLLLSTSIINYYQPFIGKMVITSYISQASALPFLLFHFYELPLISIVANIIFIPLYSFIILPAVLLLFFLQFISNGLFQLLLDFISLIVGWSDQLAIQLSDIPMTRVVPGKPSFLFLFLYSLSTLSALYFWDQRKHLNRFLLLPWIVLFLHLLAPFLSTQGEVAVIDVGQGDSILIKLPYNNGNYLIDTGGNITFPVEEWKQKNNKYDVSKDVLVPYLKSKGIYSLDLLILTHGDLDHIGGSLALLKEIRVKQILMPSTSGDISSKEKEIIDFAEKRNIKISYAFKGMYWSKGKSDFTILSPPMNFNGEKNDGSIVLYAKIGGMGWLFTGDLGKDGEKQLIQSYSHLTINILKVGHHGSKTSTSHEFIEHYKPEYAIISSGENNGFGHPHTEVLSILESGGAKIFRTDLHGGITYKFKGNKGTFFRMIP